MKNVPFHIHYNRELGKKYYSKHDYYDDMKRQGLEPYNPDSVKKSEPAKYVQSKWVKDMLRDITNRKGRPPGDKFLTELAKRGQTKEAYEKARRLADATKSR